MKPPSIVQLEFQNNQSYVVADRIEGGMGSVYKLYPVVDNEPTIAMKTIKGESSIKLFDNECEAWLSISYHPNIAKAFAFGSWNGIPSVLVDWYPSSLDKIKATSLSYAEIIKLVVGTVSALNFAYDQKRLIHQDIKPANIILLDNGGVKLADFGVAHIKESDLTVAGNMVGTPSYMSPEGLRGKAVDLRADLYSTGMVLLEILSGNKPTTEELYTKEIDAFLDEVFQNKNNINKDLQDIIRKVLNKDPDKRFQNAEVFLRAIEDYQNNNSKLESLGGAAQSLSETVISKRPLIEEHDISLNPTWSDQLLNELEQGLASYVGPMASILIKKSSGISHSVDELINKLAENIPDQNEKIEFLRKAKKTQEREATLEKSTERSAISSISISKHISEENLMNITKEFAFYIGPLAKKLIDRELKNFSGKDILFANLARHIEDSEDRENFLKKIKSF